MRSVRLSGWRKIAGALWDAPNDPQVYGLLELDATPVLNFIAKARADGQRVTATHVVGCALSHALAAVPELNVRLLDDRAVDRESIDIFFITSVEKGNDLTGVKVTNVNDKGAIEVARELNERSRNMKRGDDPDLARSKRMMQALPRPVLRVALKAASWLTGARGKSIRWLGLAESPFGSAMVSSVGMFGLPIGFAPLAWMYRVPIIVVIGQITDKPVAVLGRVEVRPMVPICATIDHRYVDGAHLGKALKAFREYLQNPELFERAHSRAIADRPN